MAAAFIPRRLKQCIRLLCLGYSDKQAAFEMGIAPQTICQYKTKWKKAHFVDQRGRSDVPLLVAMALREKIVTKKELIENMERFLK